MTDDNMSEIQVPIPDELTALIGALNTAGGELPEALRDLLASRILFMPADLKSHPVDAPENMDTLDMFTEGLDTLIAAYIKGIEVNPDTERIDLVQNSLNRFAVSKFSAMEIGAMLSVAIDRLARKQVREDQARAAEHAMLQERLRWMAEQQPESTESE